MQLFYTLIKIASKVTKGEGGIDFGSKLCFIINVPNDSCSGLQTFLKFVLGLRI